MIIRTGLDEIRSIGRNTQGVRLIKLKPGDKLVAVAKIISEEVNDSKPNSNNKKNQSSENKKNNSKTVKKKRPK
jgi:DNA gyrase subunit A